MSVMRAGRMLWRLNQETIYLKKWFNLKAIDRSQSKERVSMLQVGFKLLNQFKDFDVRIKQYTPLGKTQQRGEAAPSQNWARKL